MVMGRNGNSFFTQGRIKEMEFANCLSKLMGGTVEMSNSDEDINRHVDIIWTPPMKNKRQCTFDIKGMRKNKRSDTSLSGEVTWVEFQNVNGMAGSLYGAEDYIAFETETAWVIVRRNVFAERCEKSITSKTIHTEVPKENFLLYQRTGRKDLIMKVPMSFVMECACKVLNK